MFTCNFSRIYPDLYTQQPMPYDNNNRDEYNTPPVNNANIGDNSLSYLFDKKPKHMLIQ